MKNTHHILFFEPRIEGHHLLWLPLICDILLDAGYQLTLAIDERTDEACKRIAAKSPYLLEKVRVISAYGQNGDIRKGSKIKAAADCFEESGADEVFFNSLDEFTSSVFRHAVFGLFMPPVILRGKISGVYVRPRPLDPAEKGFNNLLKKRGLRKLEKNGWFKKIFLLDEFLVKDQNNDLYSFLSDPWQSSYDLAQSDAIKKLELPEDRPILLHYGTASHRKGLHLLIEAVEEPFFLLVAGDQSKNPDDLAQLRKLEEAGNAKILNWYVSPEEEKICFCAAHWVALPYISHYGSSSILSQAAAAGKPVIASDYHLLGKRVQEHHLGLTFDNDNANSLKVALKKALAEAPNLYTDDLKSYAGKNSIEAFKSALLLEYPPLGNM